MNNVDSSKEYWTISKKWPKRILWASFAIGLVYFVTAPLVCDYTDRARTSELIVVLEAAEQKVEAMLTENPGRRIELNAKELIPAALQVKSKDDRTIDIVYREISEKGEIKVFASELGVMLIMTPTVHDGKVTWTCWGRPSRLVPEACSRSI